MRSIARLSIGVTVLAVVGCGGDTAPPDLTPRTLQIAAGDRQSARVGTALVNDPVFIVSNAGGKPLAGAIVSFTPSGSGTVASSADTSDAGGQVQAHWTLGTVADEPQTLIATVVGSINSAAPMAVSASITATAIPGPAATLSATSASLHGRLGDPIASPIVVTMADAFGNRVTTPGTLVSARVEDATRSALVGTATAMTDATGTATLIGFSITGRAGSTALIVESAGLSPARLTTLLDVGPAARVVATASGPLQATAGSTGPSIGARVMDAWDNPVPGVDVVFVIDGIGSLGHAPSDATGTATISGWRAPAAGTYTITLTANGVATAARTALTTTPVQPAKITLTSPTSLTSMTAGARLQITVLVTGSDGNPFAGAIVTYAVGAESINSIKTAGDGTAQFFIGAPTAAGPTVISLHAGPSDLSIPVQVRGGPVAKVELLSASQISVVAGSTYSVDVRASDVYGNPSEAVVLAHEVGPEFLAVFPGDLLAGAGGITGLDGTAHLQIVAASVALTTHGYIYAKNAIVPGAQYALYTSASRGTLHFGDRIGYPCSLGVNSSTSGFGVVYGATGHAAPGVPVTLSLAPGGGLLFTAPFPAPGVTSTVVTTDAGGLFSYNWAMPATAGTYLLTASVPAPYAERSPIGLSCAAHP